MERSAPERRAGRKPKEGKCQRDWSPQRKCNPCRLRTGACLRSVAEPATTSAPAESQPRERHAPERYEEAFPSETRDQQESDHEAARKKLKPPPVKMKEDGKQQQEEETRQQVPSAT